MGKPLGPPISRRVIPHTPPPTLPAVIYALDVPQSAMHEAGAKGWRVLNPSVVAHKGELRVSIRLWGPGAGWASRGTHHMANIIGRIDDDWRFVDAKPMSGAQFEDLRLFTMDGKLTACGVATDHSPWPHIVVLDLDETGDVINAHVLPATNPEKNWMPVVDSAGLRFVYSTQPLRVVPYDSVRHTVSHGLVTQPMSDIRGSSQLVPYEGGWLAVVHERKQPTRNDLNHHCAYHWCRGAHYTHRFARFSEDLSRVTIGSSWMFKHEGIEFCCGLTRWDGDWILSFGFEDRQACLAHVLDTTMRDLAPGVP